MIYIIVPSAIVLGGLPCSALRCRSGVAKRTPSKSCSIGGDIEPRSAYKCRSGVRETNAVEVNVASSDVEILSSSSCFGAQKNSQNLLHICRGMNRVVTVYIHVYIIYGVNLVHKEYEQKRRGKAHSRCVQACLFTIALEWVADRPT